MYEKIFNKFQNQYKKIRKRKYQNKNNKDVDRKPLKKKFPRVRKKNKNESISIDLRVNVFK